jgi:hypothetical protein
MSEKVMRKLYKAAAGYIMRRNLEAHE